MTGLDTPSPELQPLERLLSINEVAQLLRISESSVYRLVRRAELARLKVGGRTLFEPSQVRQFIAASRADGSLTVAVDQSLSRAS